VVSNVLISLSSQSTHGKPLTSFIEHGVYDFFHTAMINLSNNRLQSTIPGWIDRWNQLETLVLSGNEFFGTIPLSLYNLSTLRKFSFVPFVDACDDSLFSGQAVPFIVVHNALGEFVVVGAD
jgi:hypothetical protein